MRFISVSFPRLALRARVALRAKYRVRPAWLIKRLSCRLGSIGDQGNLAFHVTDVLAQVVLCIMHLINVNPVGGRGGGSAGKGRGFDA